MNFVLNLLLKEPSLPEDTHLKLFSKKQAKRIIVSGGGVNERVGSGGVNT